MAWEVSGTTLAICGALAPFASCNKAKARRTTRTCWTPPLNSLVISFWSFGAISMLRGGRPIPRVCAKTILHKNGFYPDLQAVEDLGRNFCITTPAWRTATIAAMTRRLTLIFGLLGVMWMGEVIFENLGDTTVLGECS